MSHNNQKKIAVINDFCGFGRCSIAVSLPIISAMKLQCCSLPTAIFSNHTEYPSYFCSDYTEYMDAYMQEWKKLNLRFDGILTGYLGSAAQIEIVKRFLEHFRTEETVVMIDPVMGDGGKLYPDYPPALTEGMRSLVAHADIVTPNLTEACILGETDYREDMDAAQLELLCEKISRFGPKRIVISGLTRGDYLENYIYEVGKPSTIVREGRVGPCRPGTGDVFASVILGDTVKGKPLAEGVSHAAAFIAKVMGHTLALQIPLTDGLCFEEFLSEI